MHASTNESEEFFQQLIEIKDYAIIMLSPDGRILSWNLGAQHIFGYSAGEVIDKHFAICYALDHQKAGMIDNHLMTSINGGCLELEWQLAKKDDSLIYVKLSYTPLYGKAGVPRGFSATVRDITMQKYLAEENRLLHEKLEERVQQRTRELEHANNELSAFSYSVSHDLRTPLRAISGYSKMFLEDYGNTLNDEGARIFNNIIENTELMAKLIDDLLEFSKLSRLEVLDKQIDVKAIIDKCISDLLLIWSEKEYNIIVGEIPGCQADANMMKQVWMNLIENALKYSSKVDMPVIVIDCTQNGSAYTYSIRDNGAGFDMQYAGKLFGVFQRLHTNDEFQGTGLGLALVNRIITKHGGRVWAESEVNNGTAIYFTILKR